MKKWFIIVLCVVVVAAGGGIIWYMNKGKAEQPEAITPTAVVQKGPLESKVSGSGSLSPAIDEDLKVAENKTVNEVLVSKDEKVKKGEDLVTFTDGSVLEAPHDGTITSVNVYDGSRVNAGQVIAHLTNYSDLNMVVQVDELDIPKVKAGQNVEVIVNAFPEQKYEGVVKEIASEGTVTNGVSKFDVTVHLSSSKNLKAGMTATADIIIAKKENALYVPIGAVHSLNGKYFVYVQDTAQQNTESAAASGSAADYEGNGRRVFVKTGLHNDNYIEIVSGLKQGQVVLLPKIVRNANQNQSSNGQRMPGMFGGNMGGFGGFGGQYRMNGGTNRGGDR